MKRIATSRRVRHIVLCLQWLLLLGGVPLSSVVQGMPLQMEMQAARPMDAAPRNAPAVDCRSFAFCCIAPAVPVRAFGTPERPDAACVAIAWERDDVGDTVTPASRALTPPTVALRVLHCCWRN